MRLALSIIIALLFATAAGAGGLTPAGPPAPTMKTLDEVEPRIPIGPDTTPGATGALFVIDQAGSYYLTQNWTVGVDDVGIVINSFPVTIDLNGYTLSSFGGDSIGIANNTGADQIVVRNGHLLRMGEGVRGGGTYEDLTIGETSFDAIRALGPSLTVRRVTIDGGGNNSNGVLAGGVPCVVADSTISGGINIGVFGEEVVVTNTTVTGAATGFFIGGVARGCTARDGGTGFETIGVAPVTFENCIAENMTQEGFDTTSENAALRGCATRNANVGFRVGDGGAVLENCIANASATHGFVLADAVATNCIADGAGASGFQLLDTGVSLSDCVASGATIGFEIDAEATLTRCAARDNSDWGFLIGDGASASHPASGTTLRDCVATRNGIDQIAILGADYVRVLGCRVSDDNTSSNTRDADGIRADANANGLLIEGNHATRCDRGFRILGTGNTVLGNRAADNLLNYDIAAGNEAAPVEFPSSATSPVANIRY